MNPRTIRLPLAAALLSAALAAAPLHARAHGESASALSALSALPVAVSVAVPVGLLASGAVLTLVAVEAASDGVVWVVERAADGSRATMRFSAQAAGGLSVVAGTAIVVTAVSTGCILSAAGRAVAFVPNAAGRALLHNERVSL